VYGNTWENIGGANGEQGQHWAALEVNRAVEVNVYDNTISNVSLGQWGEGQALQFWNIDTLNVYHNVISNNAQGIFVYGDAGGGLGGPFAVPGGSIHDNCISGNTAYGLDLDPAATGGPLQATFNWWGAGDGPSGAGSGAGDAVSANVSFDPWHTSPVVGVCGDGIIIHKYHERNGNGVQDAGEEDIAGWTMRVYEYDPGVGATLLLESVTDAQGDANFGGLEPGLYKAWESGRTCWKAVEYDNTRDGGFYKIVELGQENVRVEFGNVNFCEPGDEPSIDVEKYVSVDDGQTWHDADTPPGPMVLVGSETVWFKFVVINDGDIELTGITLNDSDFDVSGCALTDPLGLGDSFECVIGPFVAVAGQHINTATATGDSGGETFEDTDRAKYLGVLPATIIVEKQTNPDGAPDNFGFSGDAAGHIKDGEQIVVGNLLPGTYTARETASRVWSLTSIVCDDGNSSGDVNTRTATFQLEAGETVKCTFTNTLRRSTIIVEKQTDPDGAPDDFSFSGDAVGSIKDGEQIVVGSLLPGTYTSQEIVPAGWDLSDITCDDGDSSGDVNTASATFQLDPGETVKCTFTNTLRRGTIIVEKQTTPDGAPDSFSFSGDAAGSIGDGGQIVVGNLLPGTYTSQEAVPAGWDLISITCDDDNSSGDVNTATATFQLEPGEVVKCTFSNTKRAVDDEAPVSWIRRLRRIRFAPAFKVHWTGYDLGGSGIRCYDVQYRDGIGEWQDWMTCTTNTSAKFRAQYGHMYSFRVRATDNAGNVEEWSPKATWTYVIKRWRQRQR
jgi:hypothetical protein